MPTFRGQGGAPVVQFDPTVEVSPFSLFRLLKAGSPPSLIDVRMDAQEEAGVEVQADLRSLRGAESMPDEAWTPAEPDTEVVLFDDNGTRAVDVARRLQRDGFPRARALFGGLDLYEFSLDPEIVGSDTFLIRGSGEGS